MGKHFDDRKDSDKLGGGTSERVEGQSWMTACRVENSKEIMHITKVPKFGEINTKQAISPV